jgi:preprotein translocase subunit YajC
MGGVQTTYQQSTQTIQNTINQKSSAACAANCTQVQTGNTVFLSGSQTGTITFDQQCTVNAQCQITQSIEAAADAISTAQQQASAKPAFFIGLVQVSTDVQISKQDIVNAINQTMDATCNNGATQIQSNNLIYAQNSTTGNIGFNQNTDVTSNCVLSNLAKGTAAATTKSDLAAQAGGIGGILGALIGVVIIVIIGIIVFIYIKKQQKNGELVKKCLSCGIGGCNKGPEDPTCAECIAKEKKKPGSGCEVLPGVGGGSSGGGGATPKLGK